MNEIQHCSIGRFTKTDCSLQPYGKYNVEKNILLLSDINQLDVIPHVKSLQLYTNFTEKCPNINESWLIRQRLNLDFSRENTIFPKHRTMYGIGWKPPTICSYPEHQKKKKASNTRAIPLPAILEIRKLFSSPAKTVFVRLGSKWCDTCRKRTHYNLCQKNSALIKTLTS